MSQFEQYLNNFSEADWYSALESLLPEIHEVDRNAVQVWFRFYPLEFHRYLQTAENRDEVIRMFALQGKFELKDQIDTSHRFLYGHRFWKTVKDEIEKAAAEFSGGDRGLADVVRDLGMAISERVKAERSLVNAITAVGLMTLDQVGLEAFKAASGETVKPSGMMSKSPEAIVAERAKDDSQGLLGFLKTVDKKFSVVYMDSDLDGRFGIINEEEIASASARDQSRDWRAHDERCWEGVVPVECRAASCGTCWVGVLGGQEKLSEVSPRERRQMKVFGYEQPDDARPFLRLACQAKAYGNGTIVIPPWNGVFGKTIYGNVDELELEPVTTSARKLRETVKEAISGSAQE
jgi:ferredoxin